MTKDHVADPRLTAAADRTGQRCADNDVAETVPIHVASSADSIARVVVLDAPDDLR